MFSSIIFPSSSMGQLEIMCPIISFSLCSKFVGLCSGVDFAFHTSALSKISSFLFHEVETKID